MSETRKLGAAATLAAIPEDGYISVLDSGGTLRKVKTSPAFDAAKIVTKDATANGWTTVATLKSVRPGGILFVADSVYKGTPRAYVLSIAMDYPNRPIVRCLGGDASKVKLRIIKENGGTAGEYRIDINLATSRIRIAAVGLLDPALQTNAEIPDGATVYEYTASELMQSNGISGGGKTLCFNQLQNRAEKRWAA